MRPSGHPGRGPHAGHRPRLDRPQRAGDQQREGEEGGCGEHCSAGAEHLPQAGRYRGGGKHRRNHPTGLFDHTSMLPSCQTMTTHPARACRRSTQPSRSPQQLRNFRRKASTGSEGDTVPAWCPAGPSGRVLVLSVRGRRGGRFGLSAGPRARPATSPPAKINPAPDGSSVAADLQQCAGPALPQVASGRRGRTRATLQVSISYLRSPDDRSDGRSPRFAAASARCHGNRCRYRLPVPGSCGT